MNVTIRPIEAADNPFIATIIRNTLVEFGANHPGTVYYDDSTDHLYEVFQQEASVYYIASTGEKIVGGGGIYPTKNLPADTCELVKIYLLPEARGTGLGRTLMNKCFDFAREAGYKNIYIETMPELRQALAVYEKFGFHYLSQPLGNSGHTGCSLWMLKEIG